MLSQRPFRDRDDVFDSAERIWWDLEPADWLEAFAAHPRIGQRAAGSGHDVPAPHAPHPTPQHWSAEEQARVADAPDGVKAALAEANTEYERRFGHIYIVCASGRGADEMLGICRARLANDPQAELKVAAAEQAKITRLRLEKLLALGS